jgi:hypothetical protein
MWRLILSSDLAATRGRAVFSPLDGVRLAIEHRSTALTLLALLTVVDFTVGNSCHTVGYIVLRAVTDKEILWSVICLDFINVMNGFPSVEQTVFAFSYKGVLKDPALPGARVLWNTYKYVAAIRHLLVSF